MNPPNPEAVPGFARRHDTWHEVTAVSAVGRRTMAAVPNYRLLRAATQIEASAGARLLLVHLIGYLGPDDPERPASRFVVFPGNTRLSDELRCTARTVQRQADELEAKGFLRRCYNGHNRRTGFDLTPFATQHEAVTADIVAIQTRRKQERAEAQLELGLSADRIERPTATSASSQGDASVTLNRTETTNKDGCATANACLDALVETTLADVGASASVEKDRTEDRLMQALSEITTVFTGRGRTAHLGWNAAIQALGAPRAAALFLAARDDPRRRATPERYFGWLLRAYLSGDGTVVAEAARRAAAKHAQTSLLPAATPTPPERSPLCEAVRDRIGPRLFDSWLASARLTQSDGELTVLATSSFTAEWIEKNLSEEIASAAASLSGKAITVRVRHAA